MNLTAETIAVSLVFVVPGFLATRLADYISPWTDRQDSAFDATLSSLTISTGILFLQASLAAVVLTILWFSSRSNFDHLELNRLVAEGLDSYFRAQPLLVAITIGGTALSSMIIGVWIGYNDLVHKILERRLTSLGLAEVEPWYIALESARREAGREFTHVEVTMTEGGEVLRGVMKAFSISAREDGTRDLVLDSVKRKGGGDPPVTEWSTDLMPGLTLLNSRDFKNLRVIYAD